MKLLSLLDSGAGAKLAFTLAGAAAPAAATLTPLPFLNLVTLASAWCGAMAAFAYYGEPSRKKMLLQATVNALLGVAVTVLLPLYFGWDWVTVESKPLAEPPLAFVVAFALRWAVPLCTEIGPAWARKKFGPPNPGA